MGALVISIGVMIVQLKVKIFCRLTNLYFFIGIAAELNFHIFKAFPRMAL